MSPSPPSSSFSSSSSSSSSSSYGEGGGEGGGAIGRDEAVEVGGYCSTHGPARRGCDDPGCSNVAVRGGKCVGLLGNLLYSSADAASSLASDEEMDEDADARGNDDDGGGVEDGGTGEVFARASGSRDGASSSTRDDEEEEDPSDTSEDGAEEVSDEISKKRREDAIAREARTEDDGERADPPPPRVGGTGQARGGDDIPREVGEEDAEQLVPQRIVPTHGRWGEGIVVPRLPPKYVHPDPVDYRRTAPGWFNQRPRSPTATEYYSAMQHRNGKAAPGPHQRDQEKVFDLDEWEAARGTKRTDAAEKASQLRAKSQHKDWQKKTWKKQCKARDSLDAKEKRANEVLAALESAKRSSTATPAPVAADAGREKTADRAPSPPSVARVGSHNQKESRDGSKEDNPLSYLLATSAKPSSPDPSHPMPNYDHDTAILHPETVANSASDSWKTSDDFENASISVSSSNESPDSVSSDKKRKDRSGHPKLNQLAVDYLRSWLLSRQHIEQPYPSEQNYADLSRATGLEKPQLKNWFVNNRRRLWRPMMNELRKRHGLAERDPLPCEVLDTLPDAPRHPYDDISPIYSSSQAHESRPRPPLQIGSQSELFQAPEVTPPSAAPAEATAALQLQDHEDAISSAADSVAAAAMMLMTGGRASSPAKNAMNGVECIDSVDQGGNSYEPKEQSQRVVSSPVIEAKASKLSTSWQVRSFPLLNAENSPPKEQVKFNLGGTVVQVPTEILLKHEGSKIAAITRSAMRVGDMAIPLPRDYEMFCHCIFYVCNEKVQLPPSVRRKDFMKEMKYYGIPFDEALVSGGKCASPITSTSKLHSTMSLPRQQQISPTTVTQLHYHAAAAPAPGPHQPGVIASKVGEPGEPRMPSPLDLLSSAMSSFIGTFSRPTSPAPDHHHPGLYGGSPFDRNDCQFVANSGALGDPTKQTFLSPLDLLSSAISSTDSSWRSQSASYATQQERNPNVRKAMCGRCEVCLRDDCGECNFCLDKPKFGGPNRLRKKCLMRRCPNMNPVPTFDASFYASATSKLLAIDGTESPIEDGKIMALHRSVVEAEKRWAENLEFLRPCIEDGGLINYAVIPDDEIRSRVKNFVKECRKQHRRIENNESTSLTEERLRLLEEANFPWSHTPYAKNLGLEVLEEKPTSSLDLLCSITSQSFEEAGSWEDDGIDDEDAHNEEEAEREESEEAEEVKSSLPTTKRVRGLNCGTCANCQRVDCGKCRACIDKPKFGGPNKSRRRCFHRRCLIRKRKLDEKPSAMEVDAIPLEQNKAVNRSGQRKPGGNHRSEEERMRAELANIRAELDAKARGVKYGLKIRSTPTIENLAREIEDEESEDEASADEVEDMDSDNSGEEDNNEDDVTRKPRIFTAPTSVERGVTVRPSGKWQVQLYYAGNSRYIGLFDSKEEASLAYEIARDCMSSFKEADPSPEQIKRNLDVMRKAAFSRDSYRSSRVEESKQIDRKKIAAEDKSRRANVVQALSDLKRSHVTKVKVEADLNAKAKSSKQDVKCVRPKNLPKVSKPENTTREVVTENVPEESRKRKFGSDIYEKAKTLAEALPRGITVRPSGKWQVQLYYAGKSRYIGVFETKIDAAVAYELARDCFGAFKDDDPTPEQAKKNVMLMRKAAFAPFQACQVDNGKRKYSKRAKVEDEGKSSKNQNTDKAVFTLDEWKAAYYPMKKSDAVNAKTSPVMCAETTSRTSPRRGVEEHEQKDEAIKALTTPTTPSLALVAADVEVRTSRITKDIPATGPGWNYFSPTGQRFRSVKEAKAKAQEIEQVFSSSDTESSSDKVYRNVKDGDFGVGYKFRKNFIDESGTDLGWFEGEVVDILSDTDKDRKCFYAANGHIEDLCIAELESCARLESKSMDSFGSVGYQFKKEFDGKWFDGVVVKIVNTDNDKDRRCHYPEDDDFEDLSMADLRRLAELEEKRNTVTEAADEIHHNDLCETCGKPGELLCCSTCNLVFHLGCTRPKLVQVPECDWSCAFCVTSGDIVKSISKQERNEARIAVREIEALKEEVRSEELRRRKSPRKRKHTMDS
ncbi:hypothetical protein ACHAW5_004156 [Stephanodiscus triporus]|uniref:Uncharacterized protein n=1 Tax=Stephanodiscus triporus TaxID=2934178 RepID=A0ABD3MRY2_9STRA